MLGIIRVLTIAVLLSSSTMALAVGDPPRQLDRREAALTYTRIRSLLTNDGTVCPTGQIPLSGRVTGGGAPGTGSQTTTIQFDKGAVVRIVKQWGNSASDEQTTTVQVSCDAGPNRVVFNPLDISKTDKTAKEQCIQTELSLRVPRTGACDKIAN